MLRTGLVTWLLASVPLSVLIGGMIRLSASADVRRPASSEPVLHLVASGS